LTFPFQFLSGIKKGILSHRDKMPRSHFKTSLEIILRSFVKKRLARVFSGAQNLERFDSTGALARVFSAAAGLAQQT
jgi:hypothetical protein